MNFEPSPAGCDGHYEVRIPHREMVFEIYSVVIQTQMNWTSDKLRTLNVSNFVGIFKRTNSFFWWKEILFAEVNQREIHCDWTVKELTDYFSSEKQKTPCKRQAPNDGTVSCRIKINL